MRKTNERNANGEYEQVQEIDLLELWSVLVSKVKAIIFFTLLGALVVNGATYLTVDPTYESTATLYVVSASSGSVVDLTDLNVGTSLKDDYNVLITRYPVLSRAITELNLDMSLDEIQSIISIENPPNTRVLNIKATTTDKALSKNIANKVAEISTEYLPNIMKTDAPSIAERARLAEKKSGPSYSRATAIGAFLGLLLSCLFFIIRFLLDNTIVTESDVEKVFGTMPIATIPFSDSVTLNNTKNKRDSLGSMVRNIVAEKGGIGIKTPRMPYSIEEAVNRLRVNITFSNENVKTIMVTSGLPNEGKSQVSINLWASIANSGLKVALVDLDIRNSTLKERLGYTYEGSEYLGIDYYLSGKAEIRDIVYPVNIENAYLVPVSNTLLNPASLLKSDKLKTLIETLRKSVDYIIIDTPPMLMVSDAEMISNICDGAVYVARSGVANKADTKYSIDSIEKYGCEVLGVVLNGVEVNGNTHYGRYGKYGHYGHYGHYGAYGEAYGKKDRNGKKDSDDEKV